MLEGTGIASGASKTAHCSQKLLGWGTEFKSPVPQMLNDLHPWLQVKRKKKMHPHSQYLPGAKDQTASQTFPTVSHPNC